MVWIAITAIPIIIWLLIVYGVYKLGEWAYDDFDRCRKNRSSDE